MALIRLVKAVLRAGVSLVLKALRLHALILNYTITYIAYVFNGKEALAVAERNTKVEEYESCNDYECSPEEESSDVYIGTALCAVDRFWAKAEDKTLQIVKRSVPNKTRKLLLDAIRESYNKLKLKLRDDLEEQGVDVTRYFDPFLKMKGRKLEELKNILLGCDTGDGSLKRCDDLSRSTISCSESFSEGLEGQMSSLMKVMSSTELAFQSGTCPLAVNHMIPVLRGVKREVTTMLEFLESSKMSMSSSIREQPDEYSATA